ncbi:hypothetical protein ACHAXT_011776 [Thalassiosira profunda]
MATAPTFDPPPAGPDQEVWLLRAPAHLDVPALLDGVALDVDPRAQSGGILAAFQSDGSEYALRAGDAGEVANVRLLVRDEAGSDDSDDEEEDDAELVAHRPFHRQVHLTALLSGQTGGEPSELALAPSREAAPKPALDKSGNGSVDHMRLAYVPVPQRQGLKRRWNMPGSNVQAAAKSALYTSPPKKARRMKKEEDEEATVVDTVAAVGGDDETHVKAARSSGKKRVKREEGTPGTEGKSSGKKAKKEKKKRSEKKSKKSPKK